MLTHYNESGQAVGESHQLPEGQVAVWSSADHSFVDGSGDLVPTKYFEYDDQGQLIAVELPEVYDPIEDEIAHPRYEYGYDTEGNQTLIRDPLGRETRFTFEDGRQITRTLPLGFGEDGKANTADDPPPGTFEEEFGYDDLGRQAWHRSFEGKVTSFHYDDSAGAGGRLEVSAL